MEWSWLSSILTLLFGQVGVLGTVLIAASAYIAWQLHLEQLDHKETRRKYEEMNEKRLELFAHVLKSVGEMKTSIDALFVLTKRKRNS